MVLMSAAAVLSKVWLGMSALLPLTPVSLAPQFAERQVDSPASVPVPEAELPIARLLLTAASLVALSAESIQSAVEAPSKASPIEEQAAPCYPVLAMAFSHPCLSSAEILAVAGSVLCFASWGALGPLGLELQVVFALVSLLHSAGAVPAVPLP